MLRIPFYKPSITSAEINEVVDTLQSGWLTTGAKTKQFEQDFAQYIHQEHAVALNSCTAALHLALEAIGITAGDGVIVPTMTFAATAEVVRYFGATPILADCRESDFNLDVADAERRMLEARARGQRVAAIIPVHYGGQIGDAAGIAALAERYGMKVIEDAAHCCPAFYRPCTRPLTTADKTEERNTVGPKQTPHAWLPVGTSADISCFSFYANKCITTGEGGMACTNNAAYADRMRIMSLHGISRDAWKRYTAEGSWYYEITAPGYKYNLTDIASALGLHQLRRADQLHAKRKAIASLYLTKLGEVEELLLPVEMPDRIHSWHLFVTRLRLDRFPGLNRSEFITSLQEAGIGTSVHYLPLHMHPYYRENYAYRSADLPCMDKVYPEIVTLPLFADMKESDVEYVCHTVKQVIACQLKKSKSAGLEARALAPHLPHRKEFARSVALS